MKTKICLINNACKRFFIVVLLLICLGCETFEAPTISDSDFRYGDVHFVDRNPGFNMDFSDVLPSEIRATV